MLKCNYCGTESINYPMFRIRQAKRPKGSKYRWFNIGHCCEDCESDGKKIKYEFKEKVNLPYKTKV